jgi:hypothetical protein
MFVSFDAEKSVWGGTDVASKSVTPKALLRRRSHFHRGYCLLLIPSECEVSFDEEKTNRALFDLGSLSHFGNNFLQS